MSLELRRPSEKFFDQLDKCFNSYGRLKEEFNKAVEIGRSEGFTDEDINYWAKKHFRECKLPDRSSSYLRHDLTENITKERTEAEFDEAMKKVASEIQTDLQIMKLFKWSIRPYDVWNFKLDDKFGLEYPGQIPAEIVANTLYFFTKQGEIIIDPMAGGGVVGDVCKVMQRLCKMYDVKPIRKDIHELNIRQGFPDDEADLVFWDPPYFKKFQQEYGANSISSLSKGEYLQVFYDAARDIKSKKVALLMSDYDDEYNNRQQDNIFIDDYIQRFKAWDWRILRIIQCPLSTEQITPFTITNYIENRKLARISRNLVIFTR